MKSLEGEVQQPLLTHSTEASQNLEALDLIGVRIQNTLFSKNLIELMDASAPNTDQLFYTQYLIFLRCIK